MPSASPRLREKIDELMKQAHKAVTIPSSCKSCGTCVKCCPLKIRVFNEEGIAMTIVSDRSCGGCSLCYHRCPNNAIKLLKYDVKKENKSS